MSVALLLLALAAIIALLFAWAFWIAPRLGRLRLDIAQRSAMFAFQTVAAVAILAAGIFYLDEQQWSPRLGVEIKADTRLVPGTSPSSAVIQLAIAVTNMTETNQTVRGIEVAAAAIRGPLRLDPKTPQNIAAPLFYRHILSGPSEVGPEEIHHAFVEIPIPCELGLVRIEVRVPRPGTRRMLYERKLLVPVSEACAAKSSPQ